jgi:hypothetical protein
MEALQPGTCRPHEAIRMKLCAVPSTSGGLLRITPRMEHHDAMTRPRQEPDNTIRSFSPLGGT